MRIIFLGDIVSRVGRVGVGQVLPLIREKYKPDMVIANAENVSHGRGFGLTHYTELSNYGIDFFTGGNHSWQRRDCLDVLSKKNVIRPFNYPAGVVGRGYSMLGVGKKKIIVLNLQGRIFMHEQIDCPFHSLDVFLEQIKSITYDSIIVDFHAETTSEKIAFGLYASGRVAAVLGTHTHVQTADERILNGGTGYITDVGACCAGDSVIGVSANEVIQKFITQMPTTFDFPKTGSCDIKGVYLEVASNRTLHIERISYSCEVE